MKKYALTFILLLASVLLKASEQYIISQTALERHLDGQSIMRWQDHYGRLWVEQTRCINYIQWSRKDPHRGLYRPWQNCIK